jgi:hypothetical protein
MSLERLKTELLQRRLQANPHFELVTLDRLSESERRALGPEVDRLYGVLRPQVLGLATKAVDEDVAVLFEGLAEPAVLPAPVRQRLGAHATATVARLVLDEVLAIESEHGFVSGTAARSSLFDAEAGLEAGGDRIAQISRAALEYASRIVLPATDALWMRLYLYNRMPHSPRWARRFPNAAEVSAILAGPPASATRKLLASCFVPVAPDPHNDRWRIHAHRLPRGRLERDQPRYKLYVSPHPSAIVEAFAAVVAAAAEIGAPRFKVGCDAHGLLRSDKLIVYCSERAMIDALVDRLSPMLRGMPAHGVPFTAALSDDGLISYGIDPPPTTRIDGWSATSERSWRMWIVRWLARTIERQRRDDPGHPEPWAYALDRLRFEGVDPRTWTPGDSLFATAGRVVQ